MFRSSLTQLFLDEPSMGSLYDCDPYDTYVLAGINGEVDHHVAFRATPEMLEFSDGYNLDRALARMLLSVARYMRRFQVVTKEDAYRFLMGGRNFVGPGARDFLPAESPMTRLVDTPGLPPNFALSVGTIEPEHFGRLVFDGRHKYGAVLFVPHLLSAVEIVPTPWGHGLKRASERLPAVD